MIFEGRPDSTKAPAYAQYYFDRTIGHTNLLHALETNRDKVIEFINGLPEDKADFQYADDKWTVKGVLLHIIETERVFQYRALRFSRKDTTTIAGFEERWYVDHNNNENRQLSDLAHEFEVVRNSTIHLFKHMTASMLDFEGAANNEIVTPRNIAWMIVGHTIHHCDIIKERYLVDTDEQF
jgi:uncharacterized damage-inducible protein DinB